MLNRVTLERQLLLQRSPMTAPAAVGRLVGLQAQAVNAPYLGLWTRLSDFALPDLTAALAVRQLLVDFAAAGVEKRDLVWA